MLLNPKTKSYFLTVPKFVSERERLENEAGLKSDIKNLIQWVEKIQANINQSKGSIQIKFYDSIPLDFYCHADNRIFVGPYMPGESSGRVITYEFDEDEKGGKYYSDIFEDLWTEKKKIHFLDKNIPYYIGSQKEGVENVLRYFCDQMKGTDGQDVIGVVVMFKADSRRTIFSCNKKQERNHCYSKNAGAVGRLIELNNKLDFEKILFYRDYDNNLSFIKSYKPRVEETRKKEENLEKMRDDEMTALLAAPIIRNLNLIGAVTFDFSIMPSIYSKEIDKMKLLENEKTVESELVLNKWFCMAKFCTDIITPMLGNELEVEYKYLYEEEW